MKQNKKIEKSISAKLELPFKECLTKLKSNLSNEEIIKELEPHLTTEELNYFKTKL